MRLQENEIYVLLMSTDVADGDRFRDAAAFDGLSPIVHPDVVVHRSIFIRNHDVQNAMGLPAFEDLNVSYSRHRIPLGPALLFQR